jgi:hypothetical protein
MDKLRSEVNNLKVSNTVSIVALAVAAVEECPQPDLLDMDMRNIGDSPVDLDLSVERPRRRHGIVPNTVVGAGDENSGEAIQ